MSSNGFATALRLEPRPSARLRRLLIPFHGLVAAGLSLSSPAGPALAAGLLPLLLWREWSTLRAPRSVIRDAEGDWWIDGAGPFALRPATVASSWLVVLNLDGGEGRCRLALFPDSLPTGQWRRLRVMLRIAPRND